MAWNNNNKGGNCAKTTYKMDVSVSDGNPLKVDGVIWIKLDIKISLLLLLLFFCVSQYISNPDTFFDEVINIFIYRSVFFLLL